MNTTHSHFQQLDIQYLRNLSQLCLDLAPRFNLFFGRNGSGKTSVLEAIHLMLLSRSFRGNTKLPLVQQGEKELVLFAKIFTESGLLRLGIEKSLDEKSKIRLNGQFCSSIAKIAALFPLQLLHPDSVELVTGGTTLRRQLLDAAAFHVEHTFLEVWKKVDRLLKQRNAALREGWSWGDIQAWDQGWLVVAEELDHHRQRVFEAWLPYLNKMAAELLPELPLEFSYYRGWDSVLTLASVLKQQWPIDISRQTTRFGPHRADISIIVDGLPAAERLSRGQQKLLAITLRLSQANFLAAEQQKSSIFLVDDLPSELDNANREKVLEIFKVLPGQFFISSIETSSLAFLSQETNTAMFHMEQLGNKKII